MISPEDYSFPAHWGAKTEGNEQKQAKLKFIQIKTVDGD
jgi:hypothetical protein